MSFKLFASYFNCAGNLDGTIPTAPGILVFSSMNAILSVGGKFHAFDLALQLQSRGVLKTLITSYPSFEVQRCGILRRHTRSIILKEVAQRLWSYAPHDIRRRYNPYFILHELFDRQASKYISQSDLFIGFSSFSLHSLRRAKELGARVIIERGSTHIQFQQELIKEERDRCGIPENLYPGAHRNIVEKEFLEYAEADAISVPSVFVKKSFIAKGIPESKLIHVPYGVDLSQFKKISKADTIFRVIFAGGICIRKGVHYLIQAFAELALPNAELWLIGVVDEEMRPFLKKYAGSYRLIGKIAQRELYRYYSQGSVFAILSIEEGLALVQAQAMACGLPVIATQNTGAEDIIRQDMDGYIIKIRDIESFKEKLVHLYEHPDLCQEMSKNAQLRVQNGFTWDDYGKAMISEYQKILQKKEPVRSSCIESDVV